MNYFKNKKHNLVGLVQGSILLTSITTPVILKTNSASAMLGSLARNLSRTSTATPSVSSLVSTFENFSKTNQTTSSKFKNNTNTKSTTLGFSYLRPSLPTNSTSSQLPTKPQPKFSVLKSPTKSNTSKSPEKKSSSTSHLPSIITARGFTYLYGDESSSNTSYNLPKNTNPQNKTTSSKVRIPTTSNTKNTPYSTKPTSSNSTQINNNQETKNLTYNLEIGTQLPNRYPSFELPRQQVGDLERIIKSNIATLVKQNLPPGFSKNQPIALHFDSETGERLNAALTSFMYRSAIRTLEAINKQ